MFCCLLFIFMLKNIKSILDINYKQQKKFKLSPIHAVGYA